MKNSKILVTGGAGYIGSHVVRQLGAAGESVIALDNLSTGFEAAVTAGELIIGDTGNAALLEDIFAKHDIDTVMHFAAHTIVPESVANPLKYYRNNTASSRTLLEAANNNGVKNIVFSSTAAVYGIPEGGKASEDSPTQPINPYGTSKLMTEWMLRDLAAAGGPDYVALRYFNVAGCEPDRDASDSRRRKPPCSSRSPAKPQPGVARAFPFSARTTRHRTARACATTSTSRTWRRRTSMH